MKCEYCGEGEATIYQGSTFGLPCSPLWLFLCSPCSNEVGVGEGKPIELCGSELTDIMDEIHS